MKCFCQCSAYLVSAAISSFVVMLCAIGLLVIETNRGNIQDLYESTTIKVFFTLTFHLTSFILAALVFVFHIEKILKKSYGFQSLEKNQLWILSTGFAAIVCFVAAVVATIVDMNYVLSVGAYLLLDSVAFLLLCITFYKQREKMERFVECVLTVNRANGLSLTEQHAIDLCQLRASESEFRTMIQQSRYRHHMESVRVAEYYYLQKWCAELERLKSAEGPELKAQRIDALLKEMEERALLFGLKTVEAIRWRELAAFPRIQLPEDRELDWLEWSSSRDGECSERSAATRPFLHNGTALRHALEKHNGIYVA